MWKAFEEGLNKSEIKDIVLKEIGEEKIKNLFIELPVELLKSHEKFIPKLGSWNNLSNYNNFFIVRKKRKKSDAEKQMIEDYKLELKKIETLFNYKDLISKKKTFSYWLAEELDCNTCTYCNRNYTFTISKDKTTGRRNDDTRITRPQFDHWFSKSQHPILALSVYNLIPSCSICNSGIKGAKEFKLNDNIHPFIPNSDSYKFSYNLINENQHTVKITSSSQQMKNTISIMKLEELYKAHDDFELRDLIDLSKKYGKNYTKKLFGEMFKGLNLDDSEIYRLIFGIDTVNHQKRLMSKYKHDIIEELRKKM